MAKPSDNLEILCPDCKAVLVIDRSTGAVLEHKPAPKSKSFGSFDEAIAALKSSDASREDRFRASVDAEKRRAETLSKQFEHLVKKAEEEDDGTPPPNPLGID